MNVGDEGNSGVGRDVITKVNLEDKDDDAEIASRSPNFVFEVAMSSSSVRPRCSVV